MKFYIRHRLWCNSMELSVALRSLELNAGPVLVTVYVYRRHAYR